MSIVSVSEHHARVTASSAVTSTPPAAEPAIPAREHAAPVFPAEGAAEFEAPATTPRAMVALGSTELDVWPSNCCVGRLAPGL